MFIWKTYKIYFSGGRIFKIIDIVIKEKIKEIIEKQGIKRIKKKSYGEARAINKIKKLMNKISLQDKIELKNSFLKYYKTGYRLDLLIEKLINKEKENL